MFLLIGGAAYQLAVEPELEIFPKSVLDPFAWLTTVDFAICNVGLAVELEWLLTTLDYH